MTSKIRVEIFGESFTISGDADPDYIAELARIVDEKMREVAGTMENPNVRKVGILAALNLADELVQNGQSAGGDDLAERARRLISMLDDGITGDFN